MDFETVRRLGRRAGLIYLLMGLTAPLGLVYVPATILAPGDAAATAANIRAHEGLLRLGIASELVHQAVAVFLVLALYRLFKPVHEGLARQLVIFGALVSVPIVFLNVINDVAAIWLATGADSLSALDAPQRDALAHFFYRLHEQGITVASIFWGLWLFPFGLLVLRCGFIPRWLGVLLLLAGLGYVLASLSALLLPHMAPKVLMVAAPLEFGEIPIVFWLAVRGAVRT